LPFDNFRPYAGVGPRILIPLCCGSALASEQEEGENDEDGEEEKGGNADCDADTCGEWGFVR